MRQQGMKYLLFFLALVTMELAIFWALHMAPPDTQQGDVQRIFYFHLGSIWVSFVAFFYVLYASVRYLVSRDLKWDARAYVSGEVGLTLSTIVLITGPIWAKPTWGVWWVWDARLASMLILWLTFLGYTRLRDYIDSESKRAPISAVLGIVGGCMVPFVYMSTRWFETQHPKPVIGGGKDSGIADPHMVIALVLALVAFSLLYFILCIVGSAIHNMENRAKQISARLGYLED